MNVAYMHGKQANRGIQVPANSKPLSPLQFMIFRNSYKIVLAFKNF